MSNERGEDMNNGTNKAERAEQRIILQRLYQDYNPMHHDVYVSRYNSDLDRRRLEQYEANRGIK